MNKLNEYLQAKRKLCEAATPGPWNEGGHNAYGYSHLDYRFIADARTTMPKLLEALEKALDYVQQHQLSHAHNETEENYRPLGDAYGWCSLCQEKVGLNEDWARETLAEIERILEVSDE